MLRLPLIERQAYLDRNVTELVQYEKRWNVLVEGSLRGTLEHLGSPVLSSWIREMDLWHYKKTWGLHGTRMTGL